MAMNGIKSEPHDDAFIKQDPDAGTPQGFMDDEDTGELQIPRVGPPTAWLTRIPAWLWDALNQIDEDEEIEIGKLRVWQQASQGEPKMKFILNASHPELARIPKQYDLLIENSSPVNTYVFTEANLPGYQPGLKRPKQETRLGLLDALRPRFGGGIDKFKKRARGAIPKRTALAAVAAHEINCTPVENREYTDYQTKQIHAQLYPDRPKVVFAEMAPLDDEIDLASTGFDNMIKVAQPTRRPQENKAARIPENELLDLLHECFDEYQYWGLSDLKARTKQPEQYLKDTLHKIAYMIRGGHFASKYTLKDEFRRDKGENVNEAVKEEAKPGDDRDDVDSDEDEVEMIDIS